MTIETLGVDIANNVFQLHGVNRNGHLMSERFELALPVEGAGARFDSNGATADLCQNVAQLIAHHASLQHYSPIPVYAV